MRGAERHGRGVGRPARSSGVAWAKDKPAWAELAQLTWARRPAPEPTDAEWADYAPESRGRSKAHMPLDLFFVGTRPDGTERGAIKLSRSDPYYVWDQKELYACGGGADGTGPHAPTGKHPG